MRVNAFGILFGFMGSDGTGFRRGESIPKLKGLGSSGTASAKAPSPLGRRTAWLLDLNPVKIRLRMTDSGEIAQLVFGIHQSFERGTVT